jgi:hypothetical protein
VGGGKNPEQKCGAQYGIRNQEPAETNGGHLQAASPGKISRPPGLVEEFIVEFECARENCDVTRRDRFADIKDIKKSKKKRCSIASRRISRSGLIREFNGTRANCRRVGKDRQRDWGLQRGGGEGGVGKCSRHRRVTTFYCCDIQLPAKKQRQQNVATSSFLRLSSSR